MEYESLMRKRKLQKSPYLFNFIVCFMGYETVGRGRDSNKLRFHLESKNGDNV